MSELRVLCRVITYDPVKKAILLVRNRGQKWWCAPGGGWDHSIETIIQCAEREALEESGVQVRVVRHLYTQTLYIKEQDSVWLEHFWLAEPAGDPIVPEHHKDDFGVVDEARWFTKSELDGITAYPLVLKSGFWNVIGGIASEENRYLGHFPL